LIDDDLAQEENSMKIHPTLRIHISVLSCVAILSILLAGCGSSNGGSGSLKTDFGVNTSTKTISLGILTPLTGQVAGPIGIPLTKGIETFFDDINANGGIDGYHVNLIEKDTQYDPTMEVSAYEQIKNQVAMFAESLGTPTTQAIVPLTHTDHVLVSAATLDSYLAHEPYMVLIGTPYRLQVENAFDYVVNKLGVQDPKVGIIYQNDGYGQDGLTGYQEALACYHFTDVGHATYNITDTSFAAQALQMKAAGAKYVFLTAIPSAAATIIGTAHQIGYDPQWILQSPAYANVLLQTPVAPLLEHEAWVVTQGAMWGDQSVPGMAQMLSDIQKYNPSQGPDGYFEFGYTEAMVTYAILKKAFDNHDVTRTGLLNAFNSLGTVSVGGLYPDLHYGSSANQRVPSRDDAVFSIDPTVTGNLKNLSGDFTGTCAMQSNF
jgi:ABC-type branched-subunit amino acid transport system substrate-binding protein